MKKLMLPTLGLMLALFASACTLYFGPDDDDDQYYSYCDSTGCWTCDSYSGECWSDGGTLGCYSDYDCASGCYCDEDYGTCVETGFCSYDEDCGAGYSCDDRGSCVPDDTTTSCWDTGCPWGYYCDSWGGGCIPSTTCNVDSDCGTGYGCINGTCTPLGCTSDASCAAGCYCDESTGGCVESGYCSADSQCPSGQECDETRSTCVPDTTPPTCEELTTEAACDADPTCIPIYTGNNCTDPAGNACTSGSMNCTCETFSYATCITANPA
jgi:Cys-rich repeat protein